MKYLVEYYNIQGFSGLHSFSLEEGINSISSKYNGTGKSTLFDCLRLLAAKSNHNREDMFYMINHEETEGFFRMTTSHGEAYGFYINKEKNSFLYTRLLPNDTTVTYSEYPFPEMWQKLNLFVKNSNYVNIADRFIDLFSSSNLNFNSGFVQELMLHDEVEKVHEELLERIGEAKAVATKKYSEVYTFGLHKDNLDYFPNLQNLANLLNNIELVENYEELTGVLDEITHLQEKLTDISIDYNYTHLYRVKELISGIEQVQKEVNLTNIPNLQIWRGIKNDIRFFEEEKELIDIPYEISFLERIKEVINDLQEEKSFVDTEKYNSSLSVLFEIQSLMRNICLDKQKEIYHVQELEKTQELLEGLTCPTCKQVIKGESFCEHLS